MLALEKPAGGSTTDLSAPLKRMVEMARKRGMMILISDLLAPITTLERNLVSLTASGHEVALFQVLDPAELNFDFDKAALFHDLESGRDLYLEPSLARREYLTKLEAHNAAALATCQKLGVSYYRFATDRPLELALHDFLRGRMRRGQKAKRSGSYPIRQRG